MAHRFTYAHEPRKKRAHRIQRCDFLAEQIKGWVDAPGQAFGTTALAASSRMCYAPGELS
jgi:hypothetical protein